MASSKDPAWLKQDEKEAWTGLVSLMLLLPGKLEAPLRQVDLTLFEYLTLSTCPKHRIAESA